MNFTLDQLRAFLEVARAGGVRRAADRLNLTQPAVTARIKSLERGFGTELFDRAQNMTLTRRGDALLGYAEQYLELHSLIERDVVGADGVCRLFRIGVSETIAQSWLPDFVRSLRAEYPNLMVEITVDISSVLRQRLLSDEIDLGLLMGPVSDYRVDNTPLPQFDLQWFRACGDNASEPSMQVPVISFARDTRPYRALKTQLLERYGPSVVMFPSSSLSACFRMVAAGLGVGALPTELAKPYLDRAEIECFDPGWTPDALLFTASFLSGPNAAIGQRAAQIAQAAAKSFDK
ncbi:MAG: LysR family transcriptional regulator [Pseudomonadota bacterium]